MSGWNFTQTYCLSLTRTTWLRMSSSPRYLLATVTSLRKTLRRRGAIDRGYQDGIEEDDICLWCTALRLGWQSASDLSSKLKLALIVVSALYLILVGAVVELWLHSLRLLGVYDHE